MAKVMIRESEGKLYFYVAKKDMEEIIESIEYDSEEKWGGEAQLSNGETWFINPGPKKLPNEVVAKRVTE